MSTEPEVRRSRHLMDPNAVRKPASAEDLARLQLVQRRVMTALVVTTVFHLCAGLIIAALAIDPSLRTERIGLCVISGVFGVLGCASGLGIYRRPLLSWWLLPGLLPGILGAVFVFG